MTRIVVHNHLAGKSARDGLVVEQAVRRVRQWGKAPISARDASHNHLARDVGMRKVTIAREALRQLEAIRSLLRESGNWDVAGVQYHANSANNYIRSIQAAGLALPDWLEKDRGFLRAHNWRW